MSMLQSRSAARLENESQHLNGHLQQNQQQHLLSDFVLRTLYLILGTGTLFAYNVFMSCTDYFNSAIPEELNVSGQMATYQLTFMFLSTILLLPFTKGTDRIRATKKNDDITTTKISLCIRNAKRWMTLHSPTNRLLYGFIFTFLFLLAYLILPSSAITSSTLNLFSTFVGIADATIQSGLYILAATYNKPTLSAAASLGGGLSGFIASLLRLMTRGMFDTESTEGLRKGANLLISFAFCFSIILIGSVVVIKRDLKTRHEIAATLTNNEIQSVDESEVDANIHGQMKENKSGVCKNLWALGNIYWNTFLLNWKPIVSVFVNFFITLSLFPGVTLDIPSSGGSLSLGNWLPVVLITVFNGADCAGRYVLLNERMLPYRLLMAKMNDNEPQVLVQIVEQAGDSSMHDDDLRPIPVLQNRVRHGHKTLMHYDKLVWWPTFGRFIFFPIISICILPSDGPIIVNDILKCAVIFAFGASNGFIQCANFTVAPTLVDTEHARNAVSMILLLSIYSGLSTGAFFGLLVEKIIREW